MSQEGHQWVTAFRVAVWFGLSEQSFGEASASLTPFDGDSRIH
jgi:hypothetical protein